MGLCICDHSSRTDCPFKCLLSPQWAKLPHLDSLCWVLNNLCYRPQSTKSPSEVTEISLCFFRTTFPTICPSTPGASCELSICRLIFSEKLSWVIKLKQWNDPFRKESWSYDRCILCFFLYPVQLQLLRHPLSLDFWLRSPSHSFPFCCTLGRTLLTYLDFSLHDFLWLSLLYTFGLR